MSTPSLLLSSKNNLLALLQKKPQPKKKETIGIVLQPEALLEPAAQVEKKVSIIDISKTSGFNRTAFINKLNTKKSLPVISEEPTELAPVASELAPVASELAPAPVPSELAPVPSELAPAPVASELAPAPEVERINEEPLAPATGVIKIKKPKTTRPKPKLNIIDTDVQTAQAPPAQAPQAQKQMASAIATAKIQEGPLSMITIGDTPISERLGKKEDLVKISASPYYMSNRSTYINFIANFFDKYKKELIEESKNASCAADDDDKPFSPMTHQKIVRDYVNLYTPYRGLLLYHGLGSGKTCSSIAIAEGMKSNKKIIVMTPASLRVNYIEELKKCGDMMYRTNQFWEFISTRDNPQLIEILTSVLSLSIEYIRKNGGAWLVNMKKPSNFDSLSADQKTSLDKQIYQMISYKYKFINYNGLRKSHLEVLTEGGKINPFDDKVIIVDEAHNFVSRIVNKLTRKDAILNSLSGRLYNYLMEAKNCKIVLLTGTPIINYPNEIAILFNILRGKINTWLFNIVIDSSNTKKINEDYFNSIFKSTLLGGNIMDYLNYRPAQNILAITRNPFGFVNQTRDEKYKGVRVGDRGELSDQQFIEYVIKILGDNNIGVKHTLDKDAVTGKKIKKYDISFESYKALPDSLDEFKKYFITDRNEIQNSLLLKRRILGLSSYFRSAQENLMPAFDKSKDYHVLKIPMSDHQFRYYEIERKEERKTEAKNAMKKKTKKTKEGADIFEDSSSTYRIFSRALCNFVFPYPDIPRPKPRGDQEIDEDILDVTTNDDKVNNVDGRYEADDVPDESVTIQPELVEYEQRIKSALTALEEKKDVYFSPEGLKRFSPKFLAMLNNLTDVNNEGLHLIYSQFRTLEGIGILKLILEANGFAQFKLMKEEGTGIWKLAIKAEDMQKPKFVLYTGTETAEEKEIVRNIFNGKWKNVPSTISRELLEVSPNNNMGEIIKIFMITSSGAEGISLKNVRFVHITEPYWHPVRMEQVIGRARRICSHQDLPPELRNVNVFVYLMTLSPEQLASPESLELRKLDVSKIDNKTPLTSDEALFEISNIKESLTLQLLKSVKESSFDCTLHSVSNSKEQLNCYSYGSDDSSKFISVPSITDEENDDVFLKNKTGNKFQAVEMKINGVVYAYDSTTNKVYNLDSYKAGVPAQVGVLEINDVDGVKKYKFVKI